MSKSAIDYFARTTIAPSTSVAGRLARCIRGQSARNTRCPATPRLDGWKALVTGGGRGIGLATSRGLAARGLDIWLTSRDQAAGERVAAELTEDSGTDACFLPIDLADLQSVQAGLDVLSDRLSGEAFDVIVANAGLWPSRHSTSEQGHEIAFATNVLGHHALVRGLMERKLLSDRARVIFVSGELYIMSDACTRDYEYRTTLGGQLAYCRSKLGNLWQAFEFARRYPHLRVHAVHPGVIASELSGSSTGFVGWAKRSTMLSIEEGAETTLFCATQQGLESGTYYHNVMGRVVLRDDDPGANRAASGALWDELESLCEEGMR